MSKIFTLEKFNFLWIIIFRGITVLLFFSLFIVVVDDDVHIVVAAIYQLFLIFLNKCDFFIDCDNTHTISNT